MGLKYYQLSPPDATASATMLEDFTALISDQFAVATDVFTIQEETIIGSGSLVAIEVRVNTAIENVTGAKLSDDFKILLFKDLNHSVVLGQKYYFDSNYWLCVYSERLKSLSSNCMVRRCNDYLRWVDENGRYYNHPCIVDYSISRPKDTLGTENPVVPAGYINVYSQLNSETELIRGDQRFLFGRPNNRICWKVFGNAVQNTQNQSTIDPTSSTLLTLTVGGYQKNESLDNEVLGIADYYKYAYALSLTPAVITGNVGETRQLVATVTLSGNPVTKSVAYVSSAVSKVGVSATGSLTLSASGVAVITATMVDNSTVSASSTVTVSTSGISTEEVRITPSDDTFVLEDESKVFTAYVYSNGIVGANAFTFPLADANVPTANYVMTAVGDNTFTINNVNKYLDHPLLINATSGSFVKQISVDLKGAW